MQVWASKNPSHITRHEKARRCSCRQALWMLNFSYLLHTCLSPSVHRIHFRWIWMYHHDIPARQSRSRTLSRGSVYNLCWCSTTQVSANLDGSCIKQSNQYASSSFGEPVIEHSFLRKKTNKNMKRESSTVLDHAEMHMRRKVKSWCIIDSVEYASDSIPVCILPIVCICVLLCRKKMHRTTCRVN